ncbi:MAG: uroporphyrinogen-III C-methyltransferase [Rhizobiales bacterium]|nr:uroporphyrinogen-III C-methyltransferase [Hyphomicrobiales bacterium]
MTTTCRKLAVFPAFHKVSGKRVVVVGGGDEAAAKIRLLSETEAEIVIFAPALNREAGAALIAANGDWRGKTPALADLAGAALVFVATGSEEGDREVHALARAAGVPVNVVDRPELCDFYTPSIVNRAPVAVAVCSEGVAPVLSRHIRARIEALLAPAVGDLAGLAEKLRGKVAARIAPGAGRRRFWARFFTGAVAERTYAGDLSGAEAEAFRALEMAPERGHVSLVGAGPGAEDLLTLRAQRVLQEADVIVHDRLVPEAIVTQGRRDARRIDVGKQRGRHPVTQAEINAILVREAKAGHRVVRLKSGDPLVFGRAGEEMEALAAAGISFDVVPGVTAALAAAAENRIPLTRRDASSALVFATGHDADGETLPGWAGLALSGTTVAVYMGRAVAAGVASRLVAAGLAPATPVAVVENASRRDARSFTGRLDGLARIAGGTDPDAPVLIIIGDVVAAGAGAVASALLAEAAA